MAEENDRIELEKLLFKIYGEFSKENHNILLEKAYLIEILVLLKKISEPAKKSELYDYNNITTKQMIKIAEKPVLNRQVIYAEFLKAKQELLILNINHYINKL